MSSCNIMSLEKRGIKVIGTMVDIAENYESMGFPASLSEYSDVIKAADYSTPDKIYEVAFSTSFLDEYVKDFPDELKQYYSDRVSLITVQAVINSCGPEAIAFSSATMSSYVCVDKTLKENTTYIYVFEGGYPVVVDFTKGEDGAITVSGRFIPITNIKDADDIREFFTQDDMIEIEEIEQIK